jgi:protease-4
MPGKIGVLEVDGAIDDPRWIISQIHWLEHYPLVRAMVLRVDSPGGDVGAVQEIVGELVKFRDNVNGKVRRPIIASFAGVAASGGYYIACPADLILSNAGTLTGSIGVILEFPVAEELMKKIGIEYVVIKSGRYKDSGNFARKMSPEEREVMQQTVEDVYEQFLEAVLDGRKEALRAAVARDTGRSVKKIGDGEVKAWLRSLADGRVFSGRQAHEDGLVDEIGGYDDALAEAGRLVELGDHPGTIFPPKRRIQRSWMDYLGGMMGLPSPSGAAGHSSRVALQYLLR